MMQPVSSYFSRNYTCPVCKFNFTSLSVRSSRVFLQQKESDFHCYYHDVSPLHYKIVVCPVCNYACSNSTFSKKLPQVTVDQLTLAFSRLPISQINFSLTRDLNSVMHSFKLAVRTAQLKKDKPGELAGLILACAWISRERKDGEKEKIYLQQALKFYFHAYQNESDNIGKLDELQTAYLIGELNLRLGYYNEAVNWFNLVINNDKIKLNRVLEKMTREQWSLAREKVKKNNVATPNVITNNNEKQTKNENKNPPLNSNHKINKIKNSAKSRTLMKFNTELYKDQIEWLNLDLTNSNEFLRILLDIGIAAIGKNFSESFANKNELTKKLCQYLQD